MKSLMSTSQIDSVISGGSIAFIRQACIRVLNIYIMRILTVTIIRMMVQMVQRIKKVAPIYLVLCLFLSQSSVAVVDHFYLWFERSGGFTGISTMVEIDSRTLQADELEMLESLIDKSGFFQFQKNDTISGNVPDQFQYKITIEKGDERQVVELTESTITESIRPLINYLTQKARNRKRE